MKDQNLTKEMNMVSKERFLKIIKKQVKPKNAHRSISMDELKSAFSDLMADRDLRRNIIKTARPG